MSTTNRLWAYTAAGIAAISTACATTVTKPCTEPEKDRPKPRTTLPQQFYQDLKTLYEVVIAKGEVDFGREREQHTLHFNASPVYDCAQMVAGFYAGDQIITIDTCTDGRSVHTQSFRFLGDVTSDNIGWWKPSVGSCYCSGDQITEKTFGYQRGIDSFDTPQRSRLQEVVSAMRADVEKRK